jgi:hypothetical protein
MQLLRLLYVGVEADEYNLAFRNIIEQFQSTSVLHRHFAELLIQCYIVCFISKSGLTVILPTKNVTLELFSRLLQIRLDYSHLTFFFIHHITEYQLD